MIITVDIYTHIFRHLFSRPDEYFGICVLLIRDKWAFCIYRIILTVYIYTIPPCLKFSKIYRKIIFYLLPDMHHTSIILSEANREFVTCICIWTIFGLLTYIFIRTNYTIIMRLATDNHTVQFNSVVGRYNRCSVSNRYPQIIY